MLPDKYKNEIEVITVNYADCKSNIEKLMDKYTIIAYFGTLNLDIAAPYFPMSKLLSSDFKSEFLNFIDMNVNDKKVQKREGNEYSKARELLEKYVKYINPEMAISSIKQFIDTLNLNFNDKNGDDLINLIVHLGCMLNRCVRGYNVKFDKVEEYKKSNLKQFNILREHIKILEEEYEISINDDEICYILTILNKNNN
jgi:transcriptional regulatory protein LevR